MAFPRCLLGITFVVDIVRAVAADTDYIVRADFVHTAAARRALAAPETPGILAAPFESCWASRAFFLRTLCASRASSHLHSASDF